MPISTENTQDEEIILETREDLSFFLKNTPYDFVILKFYADWCKPCKLISPFVTSLLEDKAQKFEAQGLKNKFIFVSVDVDECFDLYAFMKKQKMINGIPALFLYSKKVYKQNEEKHMYIPQASISGTKEDEIKKVLDFII
jgi:thiol-disulfide isomerase/thioredoxin